MDALDGGIAPSAAAVAQVASDVTAEDVSFNEFVAIVDELLGNDLPEEAASAFLNGPEFQFISAWPWILLGSPSTDRRAFVAIVDEVLEELPSEAIDRSPRSTGRSYDDTRRTEPWDCSIKPPMHRPQLSHRNV